VTKSSAKHPDRHALPMLREAVPRDVAVIACGKIWTRADAEAALAKGADLIALARAAICNPDWPRAADLKRPPLTLAELRERAVSPVFADYLRRWKGFVAE
jgi:2,4-dienoyl-CoA reductase-like NADH-dependent reductase (Old Yellow Enzyme family)